MSPKDLQRFGTWIGINKFGLFAGLTNRLDVKSISNCQSRGQIVEKVLECLTITDAIKYISKLNGALFNGFNLVIADEHSAVTYQGNEKAIEVNNYDNSMLEKTNFLIVTNQGIGRIINKTPMFYAYGTKRITNIISKILASHPTDLKTELELHQYLTSLLNIHDENRYGTCIDEPENNYGTKSSSLILLKTMEKKIWNYWHRERANQAICQEEFKIMNSLEVEK